MLILALDSTALVGSVALCEDDRLLGEFTVNTGHTHSETLLPMIDAVLHTCGRTIADVDLFACTAGPGSFTGVRIGAATVKGLAFGKGRPCLGISTLEALAFNAEAFDGIICPAMDARRAQVYDALFSSDGRRLTRLCEDRAQAIEALGDELATSDGIIAGDRPIYLVGDGAALVHRTLAERLGDRLILLPERIRHQSGYAVARCALRAYEQGARGTDASLAPVYLRPSQAERTRAEALSARQNNTDLKG